LDPDLLESNSTEKYRGTYEAHGEPNIIAVGKIMMALNGGTAISRGSIGRGRAKLLTSSSRITNVGEQNNPSVE